jgi:oxygen-independent coproporphyrinogen-3 oxidase
MRVNTTTARLSAPPKDASAVRFDSEIMRRYDKEGPRYTSYPSARQFHDRLSPGAYEMAARGSPGALQGKPLSVYAHLPFCSSPCFYCGCNKVVTRQMGQVDAYVRRLLEEITLRSRYFDRKRVVEQLHFGGGTPTFLPEHLLTAIIERIGECLQLTGDGARDYSIEIDPRGTDEGVLRALSELGFNRVSLGVQDFDENVQRAVNRLQPPEAVAAVHDAARKLGFRSINFDLIYGLPRQTLATFGATLDRVVAMRPDRLAVYGYAHMPQLFKPQRRIDASELPDSATRLALLKMTIDRLCGAGYVYIGMDHFALPEDGLARALRSGTLHRSFQGYTTHADRDLVSFGVSAIGQVGDLYVQNRKSVPDYEAAVAAGELPSHLGVQMTADDALRKDVIGRIMCHGRVDCAAVERRHDIEFDKYFAREQQRLGVLEADGLIERSPGFIDLTAVGRLLMRNVAMTFDAYLSVGAAKPMSRVI